MTTEIWIRPSFRPLAHRRAFYIGRQLGDIWQSRLEGEVPGWVEALVFPALRRAAAHSWSRGGKKWKGGR